MTSDFAIVCARLRQRPSLTSIIVMSFVSSSIFAAHLLVHWLLSLLLVLSVTITVAFIVMVLDRRLDALRRDQWTHFRQTETLLGLYQMLQPPHLLPMTRQWAASPDFLRILVETMVDERPHVVVEAGCGSSTVFAAHVARGIGGCHILSLENDAECADRCRRELERHGLSAHATVVDAPLIEYKIGGHNVMWYACDKLACVSEIDLVLVDGPRQVTTFPARYPALPLLRERLSERCTILLDDGRREAEAEVVRLWKREWPDTLTTYFDTEKGTYRIHLLTPHFEAAAVESAS